MEKDVWDGMNRAKMLCVMNALVNIITLLTASQCTSHPLLIYLPLAPS